MLNPIIAYIGLIDGTRLEAYEQLDGCQYVIDDDGERSNGVWFIPPVESPLPIIVEAS